MYVLFDLEWVTAEARRSRMRDHAPAGRQDRRSQLPGTGGLLPQPHPPRQADPQTDGGPRLPGEGMPLPFDIAWAAIILCGVPIILEAIIGLVTEFDIKADVLVSLALIAGQLGIRGVRANCLPQDKLRCIDEFQQKGEPVCMIGDGINDAPALKKAEVGIAMGGTGSDIAVDAADIALVDDEVKELPHLMALSQRMMTTIKRNLTFSMALNFIAITLAITGILNPVVGALVHNAGSVLVIINSALLLNWRKNA